MKSARRLPNGWDVTACDRALTDDLYQTRRGRWIGEHETALVLEGLEPRRGDSLLEVGCGTGYFTRVLRPPIEGDIAAIDIEPTWVRYALRKDDSDTLYAVAADGRALPFADNAIDLLTSFAAVCFIPDEAAALREIVRVARRRVEIGQPKRHSPLWLRKDRNGGRGGYRGARIGTACARPGRFLNACRCAISEYVRRYTRRAQGWRESPKLYYHHGYLPALLLSFPAK